MHLGGPRGSRMARSRSGKAPLAHRAPAAVRRNRPTLQGAFDPQEAGRRRFCSTGCGRCPLLKTAACYLSLQHPRCSVYLEHLGQPEEGRSCWQVLPFRRVFVLSGILAPLTKARGAVFHSLHVVHRRRFVFAYLIEVEHYYQSVFSHLIPVEHWMVCWTEVQKLAILTRN